MEREAEITIEGVMLSQGQAMAVRVACTDFCARMGEADALGADEHGRRMAVAYKDRLTEVLDLMVKR